MRRRCARCSGGELSEVLLGTEGRLYSWTVVHLPGGGAQEDRTYAVGILQLAEGLHVQGYIAGAAPEALAIDMPMRLTLHELSHDEQGHDVVTYAFTPAEDAS